MMAALTAFDEEMSRQFDAADERALLTYVIEQKLAGDVTFTHSASREPLRLMPAAIHRGWTDLALYLIEHGAEINRRDNGIPPLVTACAYQNLRVIEALLARGANPDVSTPKGEGETDDTPLRTSAEKGDLQAVRRLVQAGADVNALNCRKHSAIGCALIPKPKPETAGIVDFLLEAGCRLSGIELHLPIVRRDVQLTRLLLDRGSPLNEPFPYNEYAGPKKGETPLTSAVRRQGHDDENVRSLGLTPTEPLRLEIIELLLARGADPNRPGAKGQAPLLIAVAQNDARGVELLLSAGADPHRAAAGAKQPTPVELAKKRKLDQIATLLTR